MKRSIAFIIGCLLAAHSITTTAQTTTGKPQRMVTLQGGVYDSFTKAKLPALVTLMREDSTVVDTMTCYTWRTESFYEFQVPAVATHYILRATLQGYDTVTTNYELRHVARNVSFQLPRMLMRRSDDLSGEQSLDGVTVTGTRIQMVYRGDTIVYNASAFRLPEGSMLDALVRQLPGAELKDNGDIYVNGRKVDYLTLNGKDFFKGKNQVMLDNLPYYTVQDIKVYNRTSRHSQLAGQEVEQKDYVMDVGLKREYSRGYLLNAEGGVGTDDRYLARLFALYFADHSRLALFGNLNNINETRKPGSEGDWKPSKMEQGLKSTRQVGASLTLEDGDKHVEENLDASVEWTSLDEQTRQTTETFATDGNIMGGSLSASRQRDFMATAHNDLSFSAPISLRSIIDISFQRGRSTSQSQDSTYRDYIINQSQNNALTRNHTLNMSAGLSWFRKLAWGDMLRFDLNGNAERSKPDERFSRDYTYYASSATSDLRNHYADTHHHRYQYSAEGSYTFQLLNHWAIAPKLGYRQWQDNTYNSNYRLDWLGDMAAGDLGWLPSTREALQGVMDNDNSTWHNNLGRRYTAELSAHKSEGSGFVSIALPLHSIHEHMHYTSAGLDTLARRHYLTFEPMFNYTHWGRRGSMQMLSFTTLMEAPSLASLMPYSDSKDALTLRINNPDLKMRRTHRLMGNLSASADSIDLHWHMGLNLMLVERAWGTRTTYDATTGRYTYMNDNVDGNWEASVYGGLNGTMDRQRRLHYTLNASAAWLHSVDFDVAYTADERRLSHVNTLNMGLNGNLKYDMDNLSLGLTASLDTRHSRSNRQNFQALNTYDYSYGLTGRYNLPLLGLELATDITMYSRRGYYSAVMNDDNLVWNAQLSRSFMRGRLTTRLQAFDMLGQVSSTKYSINAQGRTETWTNSLPRYLMLTVAYKFSIMPKGGDAGGNTKSM